MNTMPLIPVIVGIAAMLWLGLPLRYALAALVLLAGFAAFPILVACLAR